MKTKKTQLQVYLISGIFIMLLVLVLALVVYLMRNKSGNQTYLKKIKVENYKNFEEPAIGHPASCVDCEKQFVPQQKWRGQSSKCFSCERDMLRRHGEEAVFMATKQKCFDC